MLSRSRLSAAALGLFLARPAIADDRPPGRPAVAHIDVRALTMDSDFTVFMRKEVPEDVRRTALRRLWVLMQLPVSLPRALLRGGALRFRRSACHCRDARRRYQ